MIKHILSLLLLIAVCFYKPAHAQDKEIVLVDGNPSLTQLMVGKTIVLLDWLFDLKLSKAQELKIKETLIAAWKKKNQGQMKSATDFIGIYEQIFMMSEADRNKTKQKLQPALLQNLYNAEDELSAMVIAAYEASHSLAPKKMIIDSSKNNQRVGTDGFTGIYRMMRPKALNMNSGNYESGFYIEHISFLPGGILYWDLPPEGLLYFDFAVAKKTYPNDCGTYEFKNNEIHILRGPQKTKYIITRSGDRLNNPLSLGKGSFRPVPAADSLVIEGNYRRNNNEPTISFSKDRRFTDGGIFRFFGAISKPDGTNYMDDGVGGSGTYLIEQNTLELKYSDGRIKRFAFEAFPENLVDKPAIKSFLLYEQRIERY